MINIYEIKFKTIVEFEPTQEQVVEDGVEVDREESQYEETFGMFHVGSYTISEAMLKGMEFLGDGLGENEYEIVDIHLLENVNVINFPEEECPFCGVEDAAEDDILRFKCSCGHDVVVKETGWKEIDCPECGTLINRDRVIGTHGNYILLDIKGD
jgi:hypothetical protein